MSNSKEKDPKDSKNTRIQESTTKPLPDKGQKLKDGTGPRKPFQPLKTSTKDK